MTAGFLHSIETLGTLDGPGLRMIVFLQGCRLRCVYCHNPDTWIEKIIPGNNKNLTVKYYHKEKVTAAYIAEKAKGINLILRIREA